ncbi:MAG: acylphosphatase [Desulfuromonadales bacterium]|nr:acylphosphatase [Desulfuromonadales bacterium]
MNDSRAHLRIAGRVQGVFFRQSTRETARRLGLTGWVRNCRDGSVEALFEGDTAAVQQAIDWCRRGPPAARVDSLACDWQPFCGEFARFEIRD